MSMVAMPKYVSDLIYEAVKDVTKVVQSSVVKQTFAVLQHDQVLSSGWTNRAAALRILESQARYAKAIGQSAEGLRIVQGGYDADSGDRVIRNVYPKRSQWRLL